MSLDIPGPIIYQEVVLGPAPRPVLQAYMAIDQYEAINLLEALKVAPDTGDWHGQIRFKLQQLLGENKAPNRMPGPNQTAEHQRERLMAAWNRKEQT